MDDTQPAEESNSALDAIASAIAEPGTMESETQETNSTYSMDWAGYYARDKGPSSGISIWSADESGVEFAAGIGSSGYLAYRDLRDCSAQWVSDRTAVFEGSYGGRIELNFNEDGTLSVEEKGIDTNEMLPLTGLYVNTDNAASVDLSNAEFVLKNSNSQTVSEEELKGLTPMECKIARNEIYARYGRLFKDEQLQNYFESCSWYEGKIPADEFTEDILNSVEKENANIISDYEEKMKYK